MPVTEADDEIDREAFHACSSVDIAAGTVNFAQANSEQDHAASFHIQPGHAGCTFPNVDMDIEHNDKVYKETASEETVFRDRHQLGPSEFGLATRCTIHGFHGELRVVLFKESAKTADIS